MKKVSIMIFVMLLVSTVSISCRDQKSTGDKIEDSVEDAADDVGDAIDDATE